MSIARVIIGLVIWIVAGFGFWRWIDERSVAQGPESRELIPVLWEYATAPERRAVLQLNEPMRLAQGDPIFVAESDGGFRQIGEVRTIVDPRTGSTVRKATVERAEAFFYPSAPSLAGRVRLSYHAMPESLQWMINTLLPPEKKRQVGRELSDALEAHHREILTALMPVVEQSLREGLAIVEQDLADALARHQAEFEALGDKYQREIVEQEIVPLVKHEILPSVRRRAGPTATKVGQEIWRRASLWRFGWRYAYDVMPLTDRKLVEQEWQRFVDSEAMPVLEEHSDEFVEVVQLVVIDALENVHVRAGLKRSLAEMAEDPELQRLLWQISREVVVDNKRLAATLERHWSGPEARRAIELSVERFEPTIDRIGRLIFQGEDGGPTPEFARVLRHRVLGKDRRFLLLEPALEGAETSLSTNPPVLAVHCGSGDPVNPFVSTHPSTGDARLP